ncbi:TetR/AcrR family transcriptional regulator [Alteromonas halophila]|uniref:Transcriptional regulator n=1 Tax=Alteromonas halophila TaxID=516698 RepID=A0A918MVW9_9ALTE|nr:TetR/AcrR family transcriptional regulator [Alteromonas halophila]GGW75002.1 transcriptional regulator [Alteromonas halophila]
MTAEVRTRSDRKRDAIIQAAKQAFQQYGVNGTSMDTLAELANVSKRTVYNHFSAKEELVMHLIKELWHKTMASIALSYDARLPLQSQLESLLLAEVELISGDEYLELARVAFGYFFYNPEKLKEEVANLSAQETVLHRWLVAARADGRLAFDNLDYVVKELSCLLKGHCFWPQLLKIEPPLDAAQRRTIATRTTALFLSHYAI